MVCTKNYSWYCQQKHRFFSFALPGMLNTYSSMLHVHVWYVPLTYDTTWQIYVNFNIPVRISLNINKTFKVLPTYKNVPTLFFARILAETQVLFEGSLLVLGLYFTSNTVAYLYSDCTSISQILASMLCALVEKQQILIL
jgi:hypothetical protein